MYEKYGNGKIYFRWFHLFTRQSGAVITLCDICVTMNIKEGKGSIKISNKTCQQHYQFIYQSFPQSLLFVPECQVFFSVKYEFLRGLKFMCICLDFHANHDEKSLKVIWNPRRYHLSDFRVRQRLLNYIYWKIIFSMPPFAWRFLFGINIWRRYNSNLSEAENSIAQKLYLLPPPSVFPPFPFDSHNNGKKYCRKKNFSYHAQ